MRKESPLSVLKKISSTDFSSGGILNNAQANKFITFVVDESVLKNSARIERMNAPQMDLPRLHLGTRVTVGKSEGTAPSAGQYVTASGSNINLSTVALVVPWEVTWDQLEDNVEKQGFEETLIREISAAFSNDLEELAIQGDTDSEDTYLANDDGWIKLFKNDTASPAVDVDTSGLSDKTLNKTVFNAVLKGLTTKYRRNRGRLRFFVHPDNEQDYRVDLTGRDTNVGDGALTNNDNLKVFGIPIVPVVFIPSGYCILTHEKNFIMGIWRQVRVERDKDIYKGTQQYALHVRVGFAVERGEAVAYSDDVENDS